MFLSTTAATPAAPDLDGEVAVVDGASISMVSCFKVYYGYVWYELLRCLRSRNHLVRAYLNRFHPWVWSGQEEDDHDIRILCTKYIL